MKKSNPPRRALLGGLDFEDFWGPVGSPGASERDFDANPWPIVQHRAIGFCRAGVSIIGTP